MLLGPPSNINRQPPGSWSHRPPTVVPRPQGIPQSGGGEIGIEPWLMRPRRGEPGGVPGILGRPEMANQPPGGLGAPGTPLIKTGISVNPFGVMDPGPLSAGIMQRGLARGTPSFGGNADLQRLFNDNMLNNLTSSQLDFERAAAGQNAGQSLAQEQARAEAGTRKMGMYNTRLGNQLGRQGNVFGLLLQLLSQMG